MKNRRDKKVAVRGRQRRNGIAEPRSGRSDGEGERKQRRSESRRNEVTERWRGGAGAHSLSRPLIMWVTGCYVTDFPSPIKPETIIGKANKRMYNKPRKMWRSAWTAVRMDRRSIAKERSEWAEGKNRRLKMAWFTCSERFIKLKY